MNNVIPFPDQNLDNQSELQHLVLVFELLAAHPIEEQLEFIDRAASCEIGMLSEIEREGLRDACLVRWFQAEIGLST